MRALKSDLVKKMQQGGIRIPLRENDKVVFAGTVYTVRRVSKAS